MELDVSEEQEESAAIDVEEESMSPSAMSPSLGMDDDGREHHGWQYVYPAH